MTIDVQRPPWPYKAAAGDGTTDDTQALQAMIQGDHRRGILDFGCGVYKISDTLVVPHKTGFNFQGGGGFLSDQMGNTLASAIIDYRGPEGKPAFLTEGANGIWDGVSLRGNGSGANAPVGIRFQRPDGGTIGTGKVSFGYLHLEGFQVGMETGGTLNSDTCTWQYLFLRKCDVGFAMKHQQALTWMFNYVHEIGVGTIFEISEGAAGAGRIKTNMIHLATENIIMLDIKDKGGGSAGGWHDFQGVIDDNPRPKTLVRHNDSGGGDVYIKLGPGQLKPRASGTKINIDRRGEGGRTVVKLVDILNMGGLYGNVILRGQTADRPARMFVESCEIDGVNRLPDVAECRHYSMDGINNWTKDHGLQAFNVGVSDEGVSSDHVDG